MFEQREEPMAAKKRSSSSLLIGAALIIVIILIFAFFMPKAKDQTADNTVTETTTTTNTTTDTTATTGTETVIPGSGYFDFLFPADWSETTRAQKNIQNLAQGQAINYGIIADPTDNQILYFATSAYSATSNENLVSVYRYHMNDFSFERLFKANYGAAKAPMLGDQIVAEFHVIGIDGENLIILAKNYEKPEDCDNSWTEPDGESVSIVKMKMDEPYSGFEQYQLSDAAKEQVKTKISTCRVGE